MVHIGKVLRIKLNTDLKKGFCTHTPSDCCRERLVHCSFRSHLCLCHDCAIDQNLPDLFELVMGLKVSTGGPKLSPENR